MTIREGDTSHIKGHPESITGDHESIQLEPVMLCVPSSPKHFDKSETRSNAHQVQSRRADQVPYVSTSRLQSTCTHVGRRFMPPPGMGRALALSTDLLCTHNQDPLG